jgi:polysaccharide chain length determinant protein (PEP-CTERM system associated)
MEQFLGLISIHLTAAWRLKWYALGAAWVVCGLGWIGLESIPDTYETSARLFIDSDSVLYPLLKGIAVDTGPTSQLQVLQKEMLSHKIIDRLITAVFPTMPASPDPDREGLVRRLTTDIMVTSQERNLFAVTYRNRDPIVARDVVKNLVAIFLEAQSGTARAQMDDAQQFLHQQIDTYGQQLTAAENRRAEYLAMHTDVLQGEGNFAAHLASARAALETAQNERADTQIKLHTLQQQIVPIPRLLSVDAMPSALGAQPTALQRLSEAEQNLAKLRLRFTEAYPDVVAAEKLVATLRTEAANTPDPTNAADPHLLGRGISNPVYEQVRLRIVELETTSASLDIKIDNAKANVEHLEKLAREAPGIEAEYKRLDRDYTVLKSNHDELLSRLESARIAAAADASADNRRLQVIDPPRIGELPVAPKRLLLISAVLCVGLSAGVAAIAALIYLDRSFRTTLMLRDLGRPVLGGISVLVDDLAKRRAFVNTLGFALASVSLFFLYGGLVAHSMRFKFGM